MCKYSSSTYRVSGFSAIFSSTLQYSQISLRQMASSLSPNRSSPELEELKKSIYDHKDYSSLLSLLKKKKWLSKEKKTGFLKKFIETTSEYSVGADQEFYNLVLKEVKHLVPRKFELSSGIL